MAIRPTAIIFVNNDLTDSVRNMLVKQLHIDEAITGDIFDSRLALNPNYINELKSLRKRILVERTFADTTNREYADIVAFVAHGLIAVEENNIIGTTFHPELTNSKLLHKYFLEKVKNIINE